MRYINIKIFIILLILASNISWAEMTPPIMPKIQETAIPPAVTLPAPPSVPSDVPNRPLTADEAASISLYHQPSIAAAKANVTSAQGRTMQARAGLLPSLNLQSSYTNVDSLKTSTTVSTGQQGSNTTGFSSSAVVRQLLFDFNHTREVVNSASAQEKVTDANLSQAQSDLVLHIKQAFYTSLQNTRFVAVNETNLRNQQSHLNLAQARLNSGLGLPSDVVRAETAVSEAVLSLNLARNNASVSQVILAQLMGIDPRTPIQLADSSEPVMNADNVDALIETGLKQRAEIISAQSSIQASTHSINAARSSNAPSFGASAGWLGRGKSLSPDTSSLTVGVTLTFTPFDSGLTKGRVKEAQGNLKFDQAQLDQAKLTVISDVSQSYLNMKTAEQRVITAKSEEVNAEESVRLSQGRYASGLGTFLDVLDAQTALLTAQTNLVNAQSAVDQARAALSHAIGAPITQTK